MIVHDVERRIHYKIRAYNGKSDDGVIFDAWRKKIRHQAPFCSMDGPTFQTYKLEVIEALVARLGAYLACSPDCEQQIYGWSCGESISGSLVDMPPMQVLHMAYVRTPFRGRGIGKRLIQCVVPELGKQTTYFTHPTRASKHWGRIFKMVYAPHLVGFRGNHARPSTAPQDSNGDAQHSGHGRREQLAPG
jgi:GNAT superfamily N-acetyltransferase